MYTDMTGGLSKKGKWIIAILIVAVVLILALWAFGALKSFGSSGWSKMAGNRKEPYIAGWLGSSTQGRPTDYIADGSTYQNLYEKTGNLLMPPHVAKSYQQLIHPPPTTSFVPATDGRGQCAVSSTNNCPSDLYWKCEEKQWNKDAVGEALALSAVGSFYATSDVEDANLYKVVSMAHDPVSMGCMDAANLPAYTGMNPNIVGSAISTS